MLEEEKKEYMYRDDTGDSHIVVYQIFGCVKVAYISVHMENFDFSFMEHQACNGTLSYLKEKQKEWLSVHFCKAGRIEQKRENDFFYLMPGDCSVVWQDKKDKKFHFPLEHYHGISIWMEKEKISETILNCIGEEKLDVAVIIKQLCKEHEFVILRSLEPLKYIFEKSYEVSEAYQTSYLKIKFLELFFVLSQMQGAQLQYKKYAIPRSQAELVKNVTQYISQNLNKKLEIKQLTEMFGISDTYLQKSFWAVYGMPAASFIRVQKMQKAAKLLIHTEQTIGEIAEELGYLNESKFSAVFKKQMGVPPSVFRRERSRITIV